jgi:rubrerythrin
LNELIDFLFFQSIYIGTIETFNHQNSTNLQKEFKMTSVKGTKTEKNLLASFAGESQARNRYTFFSSAARKEGYEQIAAIFEETANQEKEHAKRFFGFLEGGDVEIVGTFPAGKVGTTLENLTSAAKGEHEEWTTAYPEFSKVAAEEGFAAIAKVFENIASVEKFHENRYLALLKNVQEEYIFVRETEVQWQCRNCGYIHTGKSAPTACPACAHPKAFFQLFVTAW